VAPLLADEVERKMLGDHAASVDVEPRQVSRRRQRIKRIELDLRERLSRLTEALEDSRRELGLTPQAVERVVGTALDLARQAPLSPAKHERGTAFKVGRLTGSWARTVIDLPDPLSGEPRPLTFDHSVAEEADDIVLAHLNHPLVAQSIRLLRGTIWSTTEEGLSRVTARVVPDDALQELVVVVHARLVVTGTRGARLHEEVIEAGGRLAAGRFSRQGYGPQRIRELLASTTVEMPPPQVREALTDAWPTIEGPLREALASRATERGESLQKRLESKVDEETATMRAVLTDLRKTILDALGEMAKPEQLELFDRAEREQFDHDMGALKARAEAIPQEIEREQESIKSRYERRDLRLFPAAVTFLVPRRLCESGLGDALG
jgi:hypothetical protein